MADRTPLDYERVPHERTSLLGTPVPFWVVLIAIPVVVVALLAQFHREGMGRRHLAYQAKCSNNLRQTGQACIQYANDSGHAFPDTLTTLMTNQSMSAGVFVCPSSTDTPSGSTPAQQAAGLTVAGCCSYVYVGAPLTDQSSAYCVVAWEDPANHDMRGANVVYADATVVFESFSTVVQLVPELEAGHNPPTLANISQKQAEALYAKSWKPKLTAMKTGVWAASLPRPTTQPAPSR